MYNRNQAYVVPPNFPKLFGDILIAGKAGRGFGRIYDYDTVYKSGYEKLISEHDVF